MNKKLLILSLLLLAAIILAGGIFWYTENKPKPLVSQPIVNEVANTNQPATDKSYEIIPPTKTDCTDELDTTCWNTYRNNEYGFEFKYPGVAKISVKKDDQKSVFDVIFSLKDVYGPINNLKVSESRDVIIISLFLYHSGGKNINDWLKGQLPMFDISEKKYIDDHNLILRCGRCDGPEELGNFAFTAGNFISDYENNYIVNYGGYYDRNDFLNGPNNQTPAIIFSTFRFIQ